MRPTFDGSRALVRGALALSILCGQAAAPSVARAQTADELDKARSRFRDGLSLEAAGNFAGALTKFQEVGRVKLTPQVRFHMGRCQEQLGRLNEALGEYRLAEHEASQQGLPDLPAISQARQGLEGRVPKLTIRRGRGTEMARIEVDGVELGDAQIGKPFGIDPGPHTVIAKLPGNKLFQKSAIVKESESSEIVLDAPAELEAAPVADKASTELPESPEADTAGARKSSVVPWIVGGVGVAGLAAAGGFYILRAGAKSDLDDTCRGSVCPRSLEDKQKNGELYSTLSVVSLGVGIVGLGVATYLFVSGTPSSRTETAFIPVDVAALPHGGGSVTVRARF
jgi:tetratricopeptide (TPR) repeat protein